jgi:S-adenosylmethionine synthetase
MPLPVSLAHRLARALDHARATEPWLLPDGKTQVSVEYRDNRPARIHSISLTAAIEADTPGLTVEERLRALALETFGDGDVKPDASTEIHINAGGPYETGGPARHAGLTGRKNGIDTYGEIARQSGAALSGKDPSRIDRIGAYAARHAAKNVVAAGLAERCEVHMAYAIGRARPLSLSVQTFGTGRIADVVVARRIAAAFDFRPAAIAHRFALRTRFAGAGERGFYRPLAVYGHFGRADLDLPWEATDVADALMRATLQPDVDDQRAGSGPTLRLGTGLFGKKRWVGAWRGATGTPCGGCTSMRWPGRGETGGSSMPPAGAGRGGRRGSSATGASGSLGSTTSSVPPLQSVSQTS